MKRKNPVRAAFTLIELLVVIAILAILFGLTTAAVMRYLQKVPDIQTRKDITQLASSLESFKGKFRVYPPSSIFLANDIATYNNPNPPATFAFRQRSLQYITAMWPRIQFPLDWTGAGAPSNFSTILEGDQCLVFFLRGLRGTGFSTNPKNPTLAGGNRVGPFHEFDESRLIQVTTHALGDNTGFPSYFDNYRIGPQGQPYLYFNSGLRTNSYGSDCPTFLAGGPYSKPKALPADATQFYNSNSFQIISAGRNQAFGPGGTWLASQAASIGAAGFDDLSNFHDSMMGVSN